MVASFQSTAHSKKLRAGLTRDINYYLERFGVDAKAEVPSRGRGIVISGYGVTKRYAPKTAAKLLSRAHFSDFEQISMWSFLCAIESTRYTDDTCDAMWIIGAINRKLKNLGLHSIQAHLSNGRAILTTDHGRLYLGSYDPLSLVFRLDPVNFEGLGTHSPHRIWEILTAAEIVEEV